MRFSLIVVLYKSSHHLPRLLDNVYSVLPEVDDIILVDNSGEDLSSFESNKIRIIYPEINLGYGRAMNRGVAAAKNENLILINPDIDIERFHFPPDSVSNELFIVSGKTQLMESLPIFPRLGWDLTRIGLCNIGYPFGYLRRFSPRRPLKFNQGFAAADWVPGCLLLTNKKTMDELGGFDESYFLFYEEVDLCRRAAEAGIRVGIIDTIEYENFHGISSNIDVSEIKMKAEMESLVRYYRRFNPGIWNIFCITFLKFWCGLVGGILKVATMCSKQAKLTAKAKQYLLYCRSLGFNMLFGGDK